MKKYRKFNLNHHFLVKLTDKGFEAIRKYYYLPFGEGNNMPSIFELKQKINKDGYYEMQAHFFMDVFGKYHSMSYQSLFFDLNVLIPEEELREV